jgi:putative ABC transport system substrate-binding protein
MRRIGLAVAFTVSLFAALLGAEAQEAKIPRIGVLIPGVVDEQSDYLLALGGGLRGLGYAEGKNLILEYRWAEYRNDRWAELTADLVASKVDVILSPINLATVAARQVTTTIPIVIMANADVVEAGIVQSLSRPGRNITGVVILTSEIVGKRFELLKEVLPRAKRVAYLHLPTPFAPREKKAGEQAGQRLAIQVESLEVRSLTDFEGVLQAAIRTSAEGVVVGSAPLFHRNNFEIVRLLNAHRLPAIFFDPAFARAGGLIAYGASIPEVWRRAAYFVDRILRGTKPEDLPIEQPTKFELVINLKTARALGLTIPQSLLVRADEIIQ